MARLLQTALVLVLVLSMASGCKKKQKTSPAPAAQAPMISAPVKAAPAEVKPAPPTSVADNPPMTQPEPPKPKPKPKPVAKKATPAKPTSAETTKTPEPPTVAKAALPRIVVQPAADRPGDAQAPVVPDMSHTDEAHHRQTTEQLMQSTDANLKSLKRVLNADERSILQQIQLFMEQSREATHSQDLVRAHNLALKAHLLSDELVR